jgi:hypothetical protein
LSGIPNYNAITKEIYFDQMDYVLNTKGLINQNSKLVVARRNFEKNSGKLSLFYQRKFGRRQEKHVALFEQLLTNERRFR